MVLVCLNAGKADETRHGKRRDADGLAYEEIAERLNLKLSAVKMRIKRGREEFRRLLAESRAADERATVNPA